MRAVRPSSLQASLSTPLSKSSLTRSVCRSVAVASREHQSRPTVLVLDILGSLRRGRPVPLSDLEVPTSSGCRTAPRSSCQRLQARLYAPAKEQFEELFATLHGEHQRGLALVVLAELCQGLLLTASILGSGILLHASVNELLDVLRSAMLHRQHQERQASIFFVVLVLVVQVDQDLERSGLLRCHFQGDVQGGLAMLLNPDVDLVGEELPGHGRVALSQPPRRAGARRPSAHYRHRPH